MQFENYTNLKQAVAQYAQDKTYFQITELKLALKAAEVPFSDESVKKYLYQLKKADRLFDAGRGWYSNIPQPFVLDTRPVQEIAEIIRRAFPLLNFCCWNTAQLQSYFHHLPGKNLFFVYAEKEGLNAVFEYLHEHNPNSYLNPQKRDIERSFRVTDNAIVVRPAISEEPKNGDYATIEKILVDLFIERIKLDLFDEWEYMRLLKTIVTQYRIDMAGLVRYAGRREVKEKMIKMIH